jgi:hypothetical protein
VPTSGDGFSRVVNEKGSDAGRALRRDRLQVLDSDNRDDQARVFSSDVVDIGGQDQRRIKAYIMRARRRRKRDAMQASMIAATLGNLVGTRTLMTNSSRQCTPCLLKEKHGD